MTNERTRSPGITPAGLDAWTRRTIRNASAGSGDFYHRALRISWPAFLGLLVCGFLAINALFAALYLLGAEPVAGARAGSFADHFFFSVQTFATIGYGAMYPRTLYAHALVTIEALLGLISVGLVAALAFARFSLPRSRIRFSAVAVVSNFEGERTLMIRAANARFNSIINAQAQITLLRSETTLEGQRMRRFHDLTLERARTPMFALSWLIRHKLEAPSPLAALSDEALRSGDLSLLVTITGLDETLSQTVHARYAYFGSDILLNHRFLDMVDEGDRGPRIVDLARIDATEPV